MKQLGRHAVSLTLVAGTAMGYLSSELWLSMRVYSAWPTLAAILVWASLVVAWALRLQNLRQRLALAAGCMAAFSTHFTLPVSRPGLTRLADVLQLSGNPFAYTLHWFAGTGVVLGCATYALVSLLTWRRLP